MLNRKVRKKTLITKMADLTAMLNKYLSEARNANMEAKK